MARYLGIDFGEKRVGLALSDPTLLIAQSFKTLHYDSMKKLLQEIRDIVVEYSVEKIVLGLPLTMKGTDSDKTRQVREFRENLTQFTGIPIFFMDERLTTRQAHLTLHQMGKKAGKERGKIDQMAAQTILQTFLDREKRERVL